MTYQFGDIEALYDRLVFSHEKGKSIIFIVGSPLTASQTVEKKGVLGVNDIVDLIKTEFSSNPTSTKQLDNALKLAGQNSYQSAFEFLILRRGIDYANEIIQRAVLNSYKGAPNSADVPAFLESAEKDINNWNLTPGVESLGKLLSIDSRNIFHTILTTNFDPLVQIAIAKAGGSSYTTMLHREGNLLQTRSDAVHVVHLHGSWRGSDTLHTPRQLTQVRAQLRSSLASIAKNSLLVTIGYGGWDDIITSTLAELVLDDSSFPEIAWTFYSSSLDDIPIQNKEILGKLGAGIDRGRVSLYAGIDCHEFFPNLVNLLHPPVDSVQTISATPTTRDQRELASIFDSPAQSSPVNAVPKTDVWFGRDEELSKLIATSANVIAITGIGGQGKSSLASRYFSMKKISNENSFFDWKDCREQGNTINLAICSAIEKSSGGAIKVSDISKQPITELIKILLLDLNGKSGVIVFDNVDHYIDLETNEPLGALKIVIDSVLLESPNIVFIFTARPLVKMDSPNFLEIRLYGLKLENAKSLFEYRYGNEINSDSFKRLYERTAGHPLWLSIIAAQSCGIGKSIEEILDGFHDIGVELPKQMLRQIWELLNSNQQHVLRTLAELERPESERNIEEITELKFNRLNKAILRLQSMCLIERKITQDKIEVIDLHPLIKQFVREDFEKKERESFIDKVVFYLDKRIFKFRKQLNLPIPHVVLEMWVHKVDLQINVGAMEKAIETLSEILGQLDKNGLNEEISRLAKRIFLNIDWLEAVTNYRNFDILFNKSIRSVIEVENSTEADLWLYKYELSIAGKGAQYINLCDLRAYEFWFLKDFDNAIIWATKGKILKENSNVDTIFQCDHTLALAQRDSGMLDAAFEYFKYGLTDEQIFSSESFKTRGGEFFGNLGRCFQLCDNFEKALTAYHRAATKLDDGNSSAIDQGYVRYWIAQVMGVKGRREDAILFHKAAIGKWERVAPSLTAEPAAEILELIAQYPDLTIHNNFPSWKCENRFSAWMNEPI
ncbi:SIR2 family protein [Rugamonas sp. DEMB1]|uniref:SIR2 family protein n=1 Tax=Rugamonas sp. DEMB1 TaxID=3039386 RepID=UPI00244CCE22|nr:SIR2 family protein [Rugamonas sp. DEMB1]WGG48477.1 SIR2 family protein [Rugamonas sp. DEMB1]